MEVSSSWVHMITVHSVVRNFEHNSPLDDDEWASMRRHTIIGERLAARGTQIVEVIQAVRNHHERFDGRGYPDALAGERIPEFARIIAVADSYDAMIIWSFLRTREVSSMSVTMVRGA